MCFQLISELHWRRYTFILTPVHSYSSKFLFDGGLENTFWWWWELFWSLLSLLSFHHFPALSPFCILPHPTPEFCSMILFSFSLISHFSDFFFSWLFHVFLQRLNVGVLQSSRLGTFFFFFSLTPRDLLLSSKLTTVLTITNQQMTFTFCISSSDLCELHIFQHLSSWFRIIRNLKLKISKTEFLIHLLY